jgi:hypothetical protein
MTAQVPEHLSYQGQNLRLFSEPLYSWLARRRNKHIRFKRRNTANGRGYSGHWEIIEDRLYLVSIRGTFSDGRDVTLGDLFPESPARVFANWVSGEILCPMGKILGYSHSGYSSIYESSLFLRFEQGILVGQRTVKNEAPVPDEFDFFEDI